MAITIRDDYERSSVNLTGSSVSGVGDAAVISIKPRVQESEIVSGTRWRDPSARIDEVTGIRPIFRFLDYAATATDGTYHGAPWPTTRKPMFSYDRETWYYFDNVTITSTYVEFRHDTAFTADTIYVGKSRQISVEQIGAWLDDLRTAHPTIVAPSAAATAFSPTLTTWSGQDFIAGEFASQLNELGATIPATPFYSALLSDDSIPPGNGNKDLAIVYCGVHAGEDHAHFAMAAFVDHYLGATDAAVQLRRHYEILLYPMINAPGRAGGGWRGSFTQGVGGIDDANRHFSDATPGLEIVTIPRAVIVSDVGGRSPVWALDMHGKIDADWGVFSDGTSLHTIFQSRLQTNSGFTVDDLGVPVAGFVSEHAEDALGAQLGITVEHGDPAPISDAELATWGGAIVDTLESMRQDGTFGAFPEGMYSVIYPGAQADPTATEIISGIVPGGFFAYETRPLTDQTPWSSDVINNLSPSTPYKGAAVWYDGTNTSNVVVSAQEITQPAPYVETFAATSAADLSLVDTWTLNYTESFAATCAADLSLADTWTLNYTETFTATSAADLALTDAYDSPSVAYDETFAATSAADLALTDSWALNYTDSFAATCAADLSLVDTWTLNYTESFAATSVGDLILADSYAVGANYVESFLATSVADLALTDAWTLNYTETFAATSVADLVLTEVWEYGYIETFVATSVADLDLTHTYGFQYEETFTATSAADLALADSWSADYAETFVADALADLDLTHSFTTPAAIGRIINPTLKESCDSRTVSSSKLIN